MARSDATTDRRRFLAGTAALAAVGLAGCAPGDGEGRRLVDGTRRPPVEGGIGGTGIVGVVTDLGSVVIGGQRVLLDAATGISDGFGPRRAEDLRRGHSLTVEAETRDGGLVARRIRIDHAVVGAVDRLARDGRAMRVAGVDVRLEPGIQSLAQEGARVAVSGLWKGESVVASRVDVLGGSGPDLLSGAVAGTSGAARLGGLALETGAFPAPAPGVFVTATGRAEAGRFAADRIDEGRFTGAAGPLRRLVVEGYLEPIPQAPDFTIAGFGHTFDRDADVAPLADSRALFLGPYTGVFAVEVGLPLAENPEARRVLLEPGLDLRALDAAIRTR